MRIKFKGNQDAQEAAESLISIIQLFKIRYGIKQFREIQLTLTLLNESGEDVELVDASTAEVLGVFEVQNDANMANKPRHKNSKSKTKPKPKHLHLVVDNT